MSLEYFVLEYKEESLWNDGDRLKGFKFCLKGILLIRLGKVLSIIINDGSIILQFIEQIRKLRVYININKRINLKLDDEWDIYIVLNIVCIVLKYVFIFYLL